MSVSIIPESAPFTPEQRSWLNGFLAGWAGVLQEPTPGGLATALLPGADQVADAPAEEQQEEHPWHDPALEMEDRLALAEGKPIKQQLMAAMAQLDCGACGYICQTYSEAIAAGEEKNLTLCSPGGKPTAKKLKQLLRESKSTATDGQGTVAGMEPVAATDAPASNGFARTNPYRASVRCCENLNRPGSSKHTSHVEIELGDSGLNYEVGDALGVYPLNCIDLVNEVLGCVDAEGDESLAERLTKSYCLRTVSDELIETVAELATVDAEKSQLYRLIDSDEVDNMDVLDVLRLAPSARVTPAQLTACLMPMAPRLYSIASSIKAHPGEVHLTVGRATYQGNGRTYKGVASTMFAERICPGDQVGVYVHKSHGFTTPADPAAPMIMVGPGTGIAPFRAFLEEREATNATGDNWLFFGDQHAETDFLYREQLQQMQASGVLNRVSLAFSRDQQEKIYVQDKMRAEGEELFAWLERGAHFFVCGDARRMAVDVDRALHDVIAQYGAVSEGDAAAYVKRLKDEGRYARDVY